MPSSVMRAGEVGAEFARRRAPLIGESVRDHRLGKKRHHRSDDLDPLYRDRLVLKKLSCRRDVVFRCRPRCVAGRELVDLLPRRVVRILIGLGDAGDAP